jgi:hypothetical protein
MGDTTAKEHRASFDTVEDCRAWMQAHPYNPDWDGYEIHDNLTGRQVCFLWEMFFWGQFRKKWKYINLDAHAEMVKPLDDGSNPLLDPQVQDDWVRKLTHREGADHLWGGYLENRSNLLRGHYMKEGEHWHVGLDLWVPAGTEIRAGVTSELVYAKMDPDYYGGWGGKLIFKVRDDLYFILGHLDQIVTDLRKYHSWEKVGIIGAPPVNGNFAPHLHLQCCTKFDPEVDGYHPWYDNIRADFPHPKVLEAL